MAAPHRIDVHHHPTPVLELMGGRVSGSPGIKGWTAALSLEDMDKNGIATAILSMPNRVNVWRSGDQARVGAHFIIRKQIVCAPRMT